MAEFICAMCKGTFVRTTPEDEALAELHGQFGIDVSIKECVLICDDCWQIVRPDHNAAKLAEWRANRL